MSRSRTTPLGAVARGVFAGAAGTAAMTGYQLAVQKLRGGGSSDVPAQVAKRIIEGVLHREVPEERMSQLNNAMHVFYGTSWGPLYGIVQSTVRGRVLRGGLAFGTVVWAASLVELPAMKLAPPVWQMPPKEIPIDLSYHLAYGLGVAAGYAALDR